MNPVYKISLLVLLVTLQCFSQVNPGARQIALAHSDVADGNDVFTLFNNPAGIADIQNREVGLFYSPAPFGVKELSNAFVSFVEPTSIGSFSAGFMIYGFELYKETKIAVGYSKKINNSFNIGITTVYKNISIKNYGNKGYLILNAGASLVLTDKANIGFSIENLTRTSAANEENQVPIVFMSGIRYKFIENLSSYLALRKEINYPFSVHFGTEYKIIDFLVLRIGTTNDTNSYSGGLGIIYDFLEADYAVTSHPDLGLTHQFGLLIKLSSNK